MMFDNVHGIWNYWIFGMFLLLLIAVYVSNDATQFGENGMLWALVVVFMPMMGLLFYLVIRSTWSRQAENPPTGKKMGRASLRPPRQERINPTFYSAGSSEVIMSESEIDRVESRDTQFCTTCGTKNVVSATYCNSCGVKIAAV